MVNLKISIDRAIMGAGHARCHRSRATHGAICKRCKLTDIVEYPDLGGDVQIWVGFLHSLQSSNAVPTIDNHVFPSFSDLLWFMYVHRPDVIGGINCLGIHLGVHGLEFRNFVIFVHLYEFSYVTNIGRILDGLKAR